MREEFRPAIEAMVKDLGDLERKVTESKTMINRLCELAGAPPMYADIGTVSQASIGSIRADTFYGKTLNTAMREYLEMRRGAGQGPATPRDIFEAIKRGGFKFDTTSETNALVGVRATLRKNSSVFHRLPNGEYGLLSWYPNAKPPKPKDDVTASDTLEDEEEAADEAAEAAAAAAKKTAAA